jgi:hypothetical protein
MALEYFTGQCSTPHSVAVRFAPQRDATRSLLGFWLPTENRKTGATSTTMLTGSVADMKISLNQYTIRNVRYIKAIPPDTAHSCSAVSMSVCYINITSVATIKLYTPSSDPDSMLPIISASASARLGGCQRPDASKRSPRGLPNSFCLATVSPALQDVPCCCCCGGGSGGCRCVCCIPSPSSACQAASANSTGSVISADCMRPSHGNKLAPGVRASAPLTGWEVCSHRSVHACLCLERSGPPQGDVPGAEAPDLTRARSWGVEVRLRASAVNPRTGNTLPQGRTRLSGSAAEAATAPTAVPPPPAPLCEA